MDFLKRPGMFLCFLTGARPFQTSYRMKNDVSQKSEKNVQIAEKPAYDVLNVSYEESSRSGFPSEKRPEFLSILRKCTHC